MNRLRWSVTRVLACQALVLLGSGCRADTGRLTPEQEQRFATEQILHRADNLTFRYTRASGSWENRVASIVVTRQSLLIHKNEKIGVEVTPTSRRFYEVEREGDRVRLTAGSGQARVSWSFVPPDDADAWARDIRAVIRASRSTANSPD